MAQDVALNLLKNPVKYSRPILRGVRSRLFHLMSSGQTELLFVSFQLRNLLSHGRPIRVQVGDGHFYIAPKGSAAAYFWTGIYFQRCEIEFILSHLEPGMIFMDIGANTGFFTIAAALKVGSSGRVYAFEPCTSTFEILQENIRLNGLSNVTAFCTALGDYTGEAMLQINAPWRDGLNTIGRPTHPGSRVVAQERVPISTLDVLLKSNNTPHVDVVKMDVEGAELLVLRGARALLQCDDAPLILYESRTFNTKGFGYHPVEIMWLLQECGYALLALDTEMGRAAHLVPGQSYDVEVVAVKPSHPSYSKLGLGVQ